MSNHHNDFLFLLRECQGGEIKGIFVLRLFVSTFFMSILIVFRSNCFYLFSSQNDFELGRIGLLSSLYLQSKRYMHIQSCTYHGSSFQYNGEDVFPSDNTTDDIKSLFQVKVRDLYCRSCNIDILIFYIFLTIAEKVKSGF